MDIDRTDPNETIVRERPLFMPGFCLMFLVIGTAVGLWMLLSLGFQVLKIFAGRKLARRESGFLVMTVAILSLLSFPLGTVIGIWTLFATSRKQALETAEAHVPAHPVGG